MELGIHGKQVLVTGGCSGIGAEITRSMLDEGAVVTGTSRSVPHEFLDSLPSHERASFSFLAAELGSETGVNEFVRKNKFEFDILINNAGHTCNITDPFCPPKDMLAVMQLNFLSPVTLVNAALPYMMRNKWGRVVNITSCAGLENSGPVTYTSAKAALTAYTRSMGRVLATQAREVVMTAVYPGVIMTRGGHWESVMRTDPDKVDRYLSERCPTGRFGEISEFVPSVLFFASQHASFAHGSIIGIDGGQSKHFTHHNYEP